MLRLTIFANHDARGATLLELLLGIATAATLTGMTVPAMAGTIDEIRTATAARYLAARIGSARLDAVRGSRAIALRFEPVAGDYMFAAFADGNGNGVHSSEIRDGTDPVLGSYERLRDKFPGVRFELMPDVPDANGESGTGQDGVRIGSARILTMSVDGTATSGTLYVRGRRSQYAVRVLGVTGRTRMLQYHAGDRTWINR
jgi:type II secretory pathway pseudopilin PulG